MRVTRSISIEEFEIREAFVRASGPGGQNVNKVATAVQLRFNVARSPSLPEEVRERLVKLAGKRVNKEGVLVIDARRYRTQERNRKDARDRLASLIRRAAERPRTRRATRPTRASVERRMSEKRRRGDKKRKRERISGQDE